MALGQRDQHRSSQKDFQMKIVLGVMVVVFIWLLLEYTSLIYKKFQLDTKKQWFIEENERISSNNLHLEKQYEYYKTDYFFRKEAKRKLNKREPGEKVIIVTGGDADLESAEDGDISDDILRAWWEYIFGTDSTKIYEPNELYQRHLGKY